MTCENTSAIFSDAIDMEIGARCRRPAHLSGVRCIHYNSNEILCLQPKVCSARCSKKFTANTNRSLYYKQTVFANSGEPSSTARALDAHNTYHSRYHNSIESGTIVLLNAGPARPQWRFTQVVSARSDKTRKCLYYFMNKCTSSQYKAYIAGCVLSDLYEAAAKLAMVTVLALDQNKRRYGHVAYSAFIAQQKIRKSYAPAIRGKLFPIQKLSTVDSRS